jgi:hypothetical protein
MRIKMDYMENLFVFLRVLIIVVVEQQMKFVIDQRKVIKIILIEIFLKYFLMTGAKVLTQISGLILSLFKLLENLFFFRQIQESLKIKNPCFKKDL